MTDKDLVKLLRRNPDLQLIDDGGRAPILLPSHEGNCSTARPKPVRLLTEFQMQASIFAEIDVRANADPRWGLIFAVPNGQYRAGERMEPGLRAGIPDILCPIPRRHGLMLYHGLAMELKVGDNTTTQQQDYFLDMLKRHGWYTCVVRDDPAAGIKLLEWYLEGDDA